MDYNTRKTLPTCSKCKRAVRFQSVQVIATPSGDKMVDVFQCDSCGRLLARKSPRLGRLNGRANAMARSFSASFRSLI